MNKGRGKEGITSRGMVDEGAEGKGRGLKPGGMEHEEGKGRSKGKGKRETEERCVGREQKREKKLKRRKIIQELRE